MKRFWNAGLALGLLVACPIVLAATAMAGSGSPMTAPKLAKAPVIDGVISPGEYLDGGKASYTDASEASPVKVTFWVGYDDANLYFAAKVLDEDVTGDQTEAGTPVWGDDDIEIYVDAYNAGEEVRGESDYQFLWGAAGGTNKDTGNGAGGYDFDTWQPGIKFVTKVLGTINDASDKDEGYIVEASFPLKDFGITAKAGTTVGFNVTSFDYTSDPRAMVSFFSWQPEVNLNNNHNPSFWGTLTLK